MKKYLIILLFLSCHKQPDYTGYNWWHFNGQPGQEQDASMYGLNKPMCGVSGTKLCSVLAKMDSVGRVDLKTIVKKQYKD